MMKKLLATLALILSPHLCYAAAEAVYDQAIDIETNTSDFGGNLSAADTDVQKALDTLDDLSAGPSFGTTTQIPYMNAGGTDFIYTDDLKYFLGILYAPAFGSSVSYTDVNPPASFYANPYLDLTSNAAHSLYGFQQDVILKTESGVTGSGTVGGGYFSALHRGSSIDGTGTLANAEGAHYIYGQESGGLVDTTTITGISLNPYVAGGAVTTLRDIYIATVITEGATVGTHYGIYQEDPGATNKLFGSVNLDKLTASKPILTDASKNLVSGTFGTTTQIPYMNAGGTDFIYGDLKFNGTDLLLPDSNGITLGTGGDAKIYYDGTNLVINPIAVGSGILSILGSIHPDKTTVGNAYTDNRIVSATGIGTILLSYPTLNASVTASTIATTLGADFGYQDQRTLTGSGFTSGESAGNYGLRASVYRTPSFTGTLQNYYITGLFGNVVDNGVYNTPTSTLKTCTWTTKAAGNVFSIAPTFNIGANSGTYTFYGYDITGTLDSTYTSGTITVNAYGMRVDMRGYTANATTTGYGLYMNTRSFDTNWAYYNISAAAPNLLGIDNVVSYVGTGIDSGFYYDGTNTIWKNYVGTGFFNIQMDTQMDGDTYWTGDGSGVPYANMYVEDNTTATTIGGASTWVQVTVFGTNGEANDATPDHTNDHITIGKAGRYYVSLSADCHDGTVNNQYEIAVYKNNGATQLAGMRDHIFFDFATSEPQVSISGISDLANGDTIEVWVKNNTGANNITFEFIKLSIFMLGGT